MSHFSDIGVGILDDRERIDFAGLRLARQNRLFEMMEDVGLDACLFGREANVRYASGARRFWTAQTRPFFSSCAVVGSTREIKLGSASASLDGIPEAYRPDDVLQPTWNPATAIAGLREIPGFAEARRIGVDGMTPGFKSLFETIHPDKELVAAEHLMQRIRRPKLEAEIHCLQTAAAIAEAALQAAIEEIGPGVPEKRLQGAYLARMCELGTSTFGQLGTFTSISPNGGLRWVTDGRALPDGVPVAMAGSVLWAGYEGSVARSWWCGNSLLAESDRQAHRAWAELMELVVNACNPGMTGDRIRTAFEASAPAGATLSVYALGLGCEGKIAGTDFDRAVERAQVLEADMVIAIRIFVPGESGGYLGEDMFLIGSSASEPLTTLGCGPIAA